MSQWPPPITCGDRSGFLFAHACDRLATGQCVRCAKPICVEHTRMTETGPVCVSCLREESWDRDRDSDDTDVESAPGPSAPAEEPPFAPGGGQFGGAGAGTPWSPGAGSPYAKADDPYFFGGPGDRASHYDADDYAAFSPAAATGADDAAGDADTIEGDTGAS
jgi:hypothetical protein